MKYLKIACVIALAVAFCAPAFAETQTVKVSGALDAYWFYRTNLDLRDGNDAGSIPQGVVVPTSPVTTASAIDQSDGNNFFMSIAQVEVAADLTDNVSVVIRLLNQRDWNADAFEAVDGGSTRGQENASDEFDVAVDLAYVQMKEIFYAPLTLTIGRQDLWFGRGFVLGANYQDPNGAIEANEFTGIISFDAIRATLDFDPWTLDFVYAMVDENSTNAENDRHFWFTNINYKFAEYNAVAETYLFIDVDKATLSGAAAALTDTSADNLTYTWGSRAQFDPIPNVTLGGEAAWQWGDYDSTSSTGTAQRDRSAFAAEVFGEYRWDNTWKPNVGVQWVMFSGDSGVATTTEFEGWNGLFRGPTYGDIRDWQEVFYETALNVDQAAGTNQQHFAIYGGLAPMEDMKIDAKFYFFWNDEEIVSGASSLDDDIGTELDVWVTYNYTEDVSFNQSLAWFMPGDLFNSQVGAGGNGVGDTDATAFQSVSSVKVAF